MLELVGFMAICWLAYREYQRWLDKQDPPA
jgi:hypothetical protein